MGIYTLLVWVQVRHRRLPLLSYLLLALFMVVQSSRCFEEFLLHFCETSFKFFPFFFSTSFRLVDLKLHKIFRRDAPRHSGHASRYAARMIGEKVRLQR